MDPTPAPHEYRIYADDRAQIYAVVDEIDWHWATQWRWKFKRSKRCNKLYLKRTTRSEHRGPSRDLYLHIEIMKRTGVAPASVLHNLVDHENGDSLYCRRDNLRWATREMNNANRRPARRALEARP